MLGLLQQLGAFPRPGLRIAGHRAPAPHQPQAGAPVGLMTFEWQEADRRGAAWTVLISTMAGWRKEERGRGQPACQRPGRVGGDTQEVIQLSAVRAL